MSKQSTFVLEAGSEEMKQVHALQLAMLLEVDRACRQHGLEYYLIFGTLLGAVRHGGFIPWDDDIDIGVMREDYDELLSLLNEELDSKKYFVQTAENDGGITIPFAKIRCHHTRFVEAVAAENAEYHQGVFLDIFPLDNAPDNPAARRKQKAAYLRRHLSYRYKVEGYRSERWWVNLILALSAFSDIPTQLQKRYKAMTDCSDNQSREVIAFPGAAADYDSSFLVRNELAPAVDIKFCRHSVMAPAKSKVQLESLFGDFMCLPPQEARKGHVLREFSLDTEFWAHELSTYLPFVCKE